MSHEFTSGIMMNGKAAWHGLGEVIEGTLPARDAFERAGALFPVGMLNLCAVDDINGQYIHLDDRKAIWRPDTQQVLGVASDHYKPIPNSTLLRFAESIREEVDMDTVVVLRNGAKVAFTAKIRGTRNEVIPGDVIHRNIVGYLGHDGKTSFGGMFTDVRVVCKNTLGFAQQDANRTGKQFTIRHTANDIAQIDNVLENIDMARQSFAKIVDEYREMQEHKMTFEMYRHWLTKVYNLPAKGDRPAMIEDQPRKWKQLEHAWNWGIGRHIPGVEGTVWHGFNAVTEVESSELTQGAGRRKIHSALFGNGSKVIERAQSLALELCR